MRGGMLLATVALLGSAPIGAAQTPVPISTDAGVRIRLVHASGTEVRGTLVALDEESITWVPESGGMVTLPRTSVRRLEASAGTRGHALIGALSGAVGFGVMGITTAVDPDDCGEDSLKSCSRAEAIGYGALAGALIGAFVGSMIHTEAWVPFPTRAPVSSAGVPGGLGVRVRF